LIGATNEGPGCLLLDIRMPGPNGLELQQAMMAQGHSLPIIFLTGFGDIPMSVSAMKAGAVDFLTKPVQRQALLAAVRTALGRDQDNRASNVKMKHFLACFKSLTAREKEVFSGVVSGKLNKQIAAELGTAERTIKAHRAHLMEKMQATSLAELVHIADLLPAEVPLSSNFPMANPPRSVASRAS
jgi:FixJ family two-component response regulator